MNVEQGEESSRCSIFTAAANGNIERMSILLNQGASVNSTDETEEAPLMLALLFVRSDCIRYIGVDVKGDERDGVNEGDKKDDVNEAGHVDVNGDKGDDAEGDEGDDVNEGRHVECVSLLLEHGADVNQTRMLNRSPLMEATTSGNTQCVSLLLRKGADVNQKDKMASQLCSLLLI